ncbi:unnamed protein product [Phytomonas sp. EM1]|nr:unnamed protein product [Phytomonas sp. EM1]|eukprot:CCW63199.1 unnamed protein product [Phytomonas sp. isolate EM1]
MLLMQSWRRFSPFRRLVKQCSPQRSYVTCSLVLRKDSSMDFKTSTALPTTTKPLMQSAPLLTPEELDKIIRLIENDPRILIEVVANLEPENRRRLIVTGGAMEWFGKESAASELEKADTDKDRLISPKDFDNWFESALKRNQEGKKRAEASVAAIHTDSTSTPASGLSETRSLEGNPAEESDLSLKILALIAIGAGLPFVGFGFLDNVVMILAGDFIDGTLGFYLNCSVMASAAMGNVCSGMLSMQVHGLIEKAVQCFNFKTPLLTKKQMKDRRVFLSGHIGGTLGILIGLSLGMLPLLFLDIDTTEKSDYAMFQRWDVNKRGFIEVSEIKNMLSELNLAETEEKACMLIEKYGKDNRMNFEQFNHFRKDLRDGKPIFGFFDN